MRPHPYNCHAWESDPLADLPGVDRVSRARGYNPIDEENRADFFDSLYHSAAVVGINTSAMIEAAIIGRPVFSLLAEEFAGTQEGTIHFHHLLPENGGFLRIASTIDEHVRQLSDRLRDPEAARAETQRFVAQLHPAAWPRASGDADLCRRHRAAGTRRPRPQPAPAPVWGYAVRPVVLAGAALQAAVTLVQPSRRARVRPQARAHRDAADGEGGEPDAEAVSGRSSSLSGVPRCGRRAKLAGKQWQKSIVKPLRARMR